MYRLLGGIVLFCLLAAQPTGSTSISSSTIIHDNVRSRNPEIVRPPVPVPNPFRPSSTGPDSKTHLIYQLTQAADVNIYIYDINGNVVWRCYIPRGQEGAKIGENRVPWDGRSSFNNTQPLPNGIYIAHILIEHAGEKKSLGRAKILILN